MDELVLITASILATIFGVLFVINCFSKKADAKVSQANIDWLKDEQMKPRSQVVVKLRSGELITGGFIEPRVNFATYRGRTRQIKETSVDQCETIIIDAQYDEYYHDLESNKYIATSEIEYFQIVEEAPSSIAEAYYKSSYALRGNSNEEEK